MRTTIGLTLLILLLSANLAQDAPAPKLSLERNFFMYHGQSRVGWFKAAVKEVEQDGKTLIHEEGSFYISIVRNLDAQPFVITMTGSDYHNADGTPLRSTMTTTSGPQVVRKDIEFSTDKVTVKITAEGAGPREVVLDCKDKKLYTSIGAWKKLQTEKRVKPGEKLEFHKFDDNSLAIVPESWTVSGSVTRKTRDGTTYEGTEMIIVSSGHASRMVMDQNGLPWAGTIPGGFSMEMTAAIPKDFKPDLLELESAMESDVAIKQWGKLRQMDVSIPFKHDDGDGIEPLCESNAYQDAQKFEDALGSGYLLRLKSCSLSKSFTAPALPMKDLPADVQRFTKPTALCESDDADLVAEARKLIEGVTDSREAARKINRWVYTNLEKATGDTAAASAKQAYKEKKGDCTEHAALFVALARAAGLPARNIAGIVYLSGDEAGMFGYHAWAEVWLGQWVPVDATVNELGTSARYIFFGIDEPGETAGGGRVARCMGQKIKPQIQAYELEGTTWKRKDAREFKPAAKPEGEPK